MSQDTIPGGRRVRAGATVLGVIALAACASGTSFVSKWSNPEAKGVKVQGQKVAALVISDKISTRHMAEDILARRLTNGGASGVAAYTFVSDADIKDRPKAKAAFEKEGVKAVVVMRLIQTSHETTYSPGVTYTPGVWSSAYYAGGFWGYYGYGWGAAYDPGYLRTDTVVQVETTVYDLVQDKLLWGGVSSTTNPASAQALLQDIAGKAAGEMRKAGLLL